MRMNARRPARRLVVPLLLGAMLALAGCAPGTRVAGPADVPVGPQSPALDEARALARDAQALAGSARRDADARIDRLLSQLDNATLAREAAALPDGDALYPYAGRAMLQRGLPLPRPFARSGWRFDAGNRPPAERDGYRPPVRVAVLLPLTGSLATAAAPVRDGFMAGYHNETRRRPDVQFYDTATGAAAAYDRAVEAGSDFVVGPLGRDEVGVLFGRGALEVPVLALNRAVTAPPSGAASFSLSPEDEANAAAEALLARGATRVLAIGGSDDTQRRAIAALRDALGARGVAVATATAATADFGALAQAEGGADAVFLALRGAEARAVAPKLALAGMSGKPMYATSALLSGTGKPAEDRVLDGIVFPGETWTTRGLPGLPPAAATAARISTARGPAARLFAFGHDAWLVTAYLERLATQADGRVEAATGVLRLDGFGNVLRTPAWSTFRDGVAVPFADARG